MNDDTGSPVSPEPEGTAPRAEALLRRAGGVEHPAPPRVWEAILAATRGSQPLSAVPGGSESGARPAPRRRTSWSARGAALLAAAAAGALVTWAGLEVLDRDDPGQLLASAELAPLTDDGAEGTAEVVDVDGTQRLRLRLAERPDAADGYLEVWLLRPDVSGMVTLGVLEGTEGEYLLPTGIDLQEYAVVDISREHMDGDPGHGGDSLVRGQVG